jgi:serine/threonine protein kinase
MDEQRDDKGSGSRPPDGGDRQDDRLDFDDLRTVSAHKSEIEARRALRQTELDITDMRSPTPEEVAGQDRPSSEEDESTEILAGTTWEVIERLADQDTERPLLHREVTRRLTPTEIARIHKRLRERGLPDSVAPPTNIYLTNQGRYLYIYGLLADQGNMSCVHSALAIDLLDATRPFEVIVKEVADDEIKHAVRDQQVEDDLTSGQDVDELLASQREFATTWVSKTPGSQTFGDLERTFQKELAVLRKLRSRQVVRCYGGCKVTEDIGSGRIITKHMIMLERIRGSNLAQVMVEDPERFTYEAVGRLTDDLVNALAHLEEKRTYHLDLKPLNVMVDENDRARLIDFGIAKHDYETFGQHYEVEAASILSNAPEVSSDVYPRPHRNTDKFGLGVILYYILSGGDFPYTHAALETGDAARRRTGPDGMPVDVEYEQTEAMETMREVYRMRRALAAAERTQPMDSAVEAVRAVKRERELEDKHREEHIKRMTELLARKKRNFLSREVVPVRLRGSSQHPEITQHLNYLLGTITHSCLLVDPKSRPEFKRLRDLSNEYNALIANLRRDRRVYERVAVLPIRPVRGIRRPARIAALADLAGLSFTAT